MNRFFIYLLGQLAVVVAVVSIFRFIPDRSLAASVAGVLFLVSTLAILINELPWSRRNLTIFILDGIFLLGFCVPIFVLHWLNPGQSLDEIHVFGMPAALLHQASSPMMVVCMLGAGYEGLREKANILKEKNPEI